MKKNIISLRLITMGLLVASISFTSCKKEGCTDENATNYNAEAKEDDGSCEYAQAPEPTTYTPTFTGEFSALIAINTTTTQSTPFGDQNLNIGTAVAVFSQDGGNSWVSAGDVTTESQMLEAQSNNSYTFTDIGTTNPNGITFSSPIEWTVSGGTWPAFNATTNEPHPTVSVINESSVSSGSSFTLSVNSISDADSVVFAVYGPDGHALIIKEGSSTSHTFSASEMSPIGVGNGFIQVTGVKYDLQNINNKDVYLINETVRTNSVTID